MQYRKLGRTGWEVSACSFGAWAIGSEWGNVNDKESIAAIHKAIDMGVNFLDTADVYGNGRVLFTRGSKPMSGYSICWDANPGWGFARVPDLAYEIDHPLTGFHH